jgi:secondary thiamine-phosphate synthase enzyme
MSRPENRCWEIRNLSTERVFLEARHIRFLKLSEGGMIITKELALETHVDEIVDITDLVRGAVEGSGMRSGLAVVFVPGATGAVTTIEHEPGLISDLQEALEGMATKNKEYSHNRRWGDGNGHSHIRAALVGPSLTVPFAEGRLMLGTWQQIVFLELDNRPRHRRIIVQMAGE